MSEDRQSFIARWSRRKREAKRAGPPTHGASPGGATPPAPAREASPPSKAPAERIEPRPAAAPEAAPALPPIDSLQGLASEYRDFLRPEVDESLRRAALKKLFHDPHFNAMDGLDIYIDDYNKSDPIPQAMLRQLAHARGWLFPEESQTEPRAAGSQAERSEEAAVAGSAEERIAAADAGGSAFSEESVAPDDIASPPDAAGGAAGHDRARESEDPAGVEERSGVPSACGDAKARANGRDGSSRTRTEEES